MREESRMTALVLDCSVTISWLMPDEKLDNSFKILELVAKKGVIVPAIWHLEVANVLLVAQRNRRITSEQRLSSLFILSELPISIDKSTSNHAWLETMELAEKYDLSLYDASYLELAIRLSIPIATFDKQLKNAAVKREITVI